MTKNLLSLPSADQFPSREKWLEACWKKILKSKKFFDSLVTSNERRNIIMRAAVLNLLNSRKGPRQISRELQISRQTINSIKKAIKENNYKSYRERGKTERKKKVYSHHPKKPYRRYRRTKYGKIYIY